MIHNWMVGCYPSKQLGKKLRSRSFLFISETYIACPGPVYTVMKLFTGNVKIVNRCFISREWLHNHSLVNEFAHSWPSEWAAGRFRSRDVTSLASKCLVVKTLPFCESVYFRCRLGPPELLSRHKNLSEKAEHLGSGQRRAS